MFPTPLDYLAAFALAFVSGALVAACHCKYVGKVRRNAHVRAGEAPAHA
ncbi:MULTISPECIES: hypothetical protein [Burkholderia cepacia complex]|nr:MULTISPECIES: hypothetical protein [Burkholderia cepacia complex]MBJ9727682.1 hypothetical protein [Burkholderia cenocepacia]MCA8334059.1 hypothetical protein [Burkholderia cepacia]MDN7915818.1 hypothetical protein [Burkholderia cepacia]MDR5663653.1 hypothetical protein [Burkholderia cenocepacia]MDR8025333.1 hypothetical protein [Burkholderia cenocepacia]